MSTRIAIPALLGGCLATAGALATFTHASEPLCGGRYDRPPTIEPDSVGPLRLGVSRAVLRELCAEAKDTNYFPFNGFYVDAFGSRIEVLSDMLGPGRGAADAPVFLIRITGGTLLRTKEGIGPGSTLRDAAKTWGELQVVACPAGYGYAYVPRQPWFGLRLGVECSGGGTGEASQYPDSLTIRAVEVFRPVD